MRPLTCIAVVTLGACLCSRVAASNEHSPEPRNRLVDDSSPVAWGVFLAPSFGYARGYPNQGFPRTHGFFLGVDGGVFLFNHLLGLRISHSNQESLQHHSEEDHFVLSGFFVYRYSIWLIERFVFRLGGSIGYGKHNVCYGTGDTCNSGSGLAWGARWSAGVRVLGPGRRPAGVGLDGLIRWLVVGYLGDIWWHENSGGNGVDRIMFNSHCLGLELAL